MDHGLALLVTEFLATTKIYGYLEGTEVTQVAGR
ncbi:hypothetical protein BH23PAT2_BH23PAT2_03750 [soil metagenome]